MNDFYEIAKAAYRLSRHNNHLGILSFLERTEIYKE